MRKYKRESCWPDLKGYSSMTNRLNFRRRNFKISDANNPVFSVFALLRSATSWENSHLPLNQSDTKLKSIASFSPILPCASVSFTVFTLSSYWLLMMLTFVLKSRGNHFGSGFSKLCWKLILFLLEYLVNNWQKFTWFFTYYHLWIREINWRLTAESSALDSVNQFPHKGLTLDTSAFELFTTANLHYHLSW